MNCKPGDIAVFVRNPFGNLGKMVLVKEAAPVFVSDAWRVEALSSLNGQNPFTGEIRTVPPGSMSAALDSDLRPIRDGEGEDQMLRITGKPREKETPIRTNDTRPAKLPGVEVLTK